MGKTEKIDMMIEGGNAKPDAAISQKLGPLKINIGQVMTKINEKTAAFKGMKVPVKLLIDTETKNVDLEVGIPPASELIKKELKIEKGSPMPNKMKVGNIAVEQLIKVGKMKMQSMFVHDLKTAVKNLAGSCNSLGILVESKVSADFNKDLMAGKYDDLIKKEITEVSTDKLQQLKGELEAEQERLRKEQEKIKALEEAEKAKEAKPAEEAVAPTEEKKPAEGEKGKVAEKAPAAGAAPAAEKAKEPAKKETAKK